jgi:predicted phage terminase large subunit-like protein
MVQNQITPDRNLSKKWRHLIEKMTPTERTRFVSSLSPDEINLVLYDWSLWARDGQWPPEKPWRVWVIMAGRGYGKTRAGAEWIRIKANEAREQFLALVGETSDDVRQVMVEGKSGILSVCPDHERPQWYPSRRSLIWPNGVVARCYSASDPEQLRGPEHHFAWCDEIAKWKYPEAWDNLMLGMRIGDYPQTMATTTPRPKQWLSSLIEEDGVVVNYGRTYDNKANLSPSFLLAVQQRFGQTVLAAQEIEGRLMMSHPDALWGREQLAELTKPPPPRDHLTDVLLGVDPAVGGGDETGIIVVGRAEDGSLWVLDDRSLRASPDKWANVIATTAKQWRVMKIVVEVNQGGALVEDLLRTKGVRWPIHAVRAKAGKIARAEPVAASYAEGLVFHAKRFDLLEDQMCAAIPGGTMASSPDRLDALVWGLTALMRQDRHTAKVLEF